MRIGGDPLILKMLRWKPYLINEVVGVLLRNRILDYE